MMKSEKKRGSKDPVLLGGPTPLPQVQGEPCPISANAHFKSILDFDKFHIKAVLFILSVGVQRSDVYVFSILSVLD